MSAAVALLLMLSACQPPVYRVIASVEAGRLFFELQDPAFFGLFDAPDIVADTFEVRDGDTIIWRLMPSGAQECRGRTRGLPFPLVYGEVPLCYAERVPAAALPQGREFDVVAFGRSKAEGTFRLAAGAAENLTPNWDRGS